MSVPIAGQERGFRFKPVSFRTSKFRPVQFDRRWCEIELATSYIFLFGHKWKQAVKLRVNISTAAGQPLSVYVAELQGVLWEMHWQDLELYERRILYFGFNIELAKTAAMPVSQFSER